MAFLDKDGLGHLWSKIAAKLAGKVDKTTTVNGKALSSNISLDYSDVGAAASSHGTHVSYSTTAPVMDGTASVGSASTVARSDHKHPTDTSRASQADLTALTTTVSGKLDSSTAASTYQTISNATSQHNTLTDKINAKLDASAYVVDSALSSSSTNPVQNKVVNSALSGKVPTSRTINGKALSSNISLSASDVGADASGSASSALASAKSYADSAAAAVKNDLLNGAGAAYDTLKELGDLIDTNVDAINALETVAASKADASALTSHTENKSNPHGVTLSQLGVTATAAELNIMDGVTATASEINKLDGLTATTAELNYVDGVTSNIQSQLDAKAASSTLTSHTGNKSNPHGVTASQVGAYSKSEVDSLLSGKQAAGSYASSSHTHGNITNAGAIGTTANKAVITTTNGVLTTGTIPVASGGTGSTTAAGALTNLGLTATADELNIMDGVTATTAELNYVDGVTSNIQTQLNAKQATITGGATTITSSNLTASRALVSDSSGKVAVSAVTSTELGYLDGVTSAIQTQLNAKAASSTLSSHTGNTSNPHSVTASQVGAYTKAEVDSALSGKAASSHTHTGLQAVTTAGTGAAYTATVSGITSLTKGVNFIMLPHTQSTTKTPTLNVNGLGAKTIQRYVSANDYSTEGYNESWLQTTRPVLVIYSGTYWYVQAMDKPAAYDLRGTVPIASGGTNATDAATARANLGALSSAAGAVGTSNLADGAVTASKLDPSLGLVSVSSTEPTDDQVFLWIQV